MSYSTIPSPQIVQTVVQEYFAASRSAAKVDGMVACFAENCVHQDPIEAPVLKSPAEVRQFLQSIVNLFASIELTEKFVSIHGQEAAVKWTGRGIGKNGCEVTFEGIDWFQVNADGKIQSLRGYWNPAAMLTQLQEQSGN